MTCFLISFWLELSASSEAGLGVNCGFGPLRQSIFFGQQNTGRRAVGFGNHPKLFTGARVIGAQESEAVLQAEIVFLDVFGRDFSPITTDMAIKKLPRQLAGFFNRSQRTGGCNNTTKREERLHALLFSVRAA